MKILVYGEKTITVVQGHGSAYYTPLEQYGGDTGHTDSRSDVYSFGATLFHLLTNQAPVEARERFLEQEGELAMREINKKISPRTEQAIMKAMQVHPDQRFQTMAAFRGALLGDWEPRLNPNGAMPAPNIREILRSSTEKVLAGAAMALLILSVLLTLLR